MVFVYTCESRRERMKRMRNAQMARALTGSHDPSLEGVEEEVEGGSVRASVSAASTTSKRPPGAQNR